LAALRVGYDWLKRPFVMPLWYRFLLLFAAIVAILALFTSTWPIGSLLKLTSFTVGATAIYVGIRLSGWERFGSALLAFGATVTCLSLPLLGQPAGYSTNGTQFQGIIGHPQAYGILISVPFAYGIAVWLLDGAARPRLSQILLLGAMAVTLVLSGTRTGYFSAFIGLLGGVILTSSSGKTFNRLLFHPATYFGLALFIALVAISNPSAQVEAFFFERSAASYDPYGLSVDPKYSVVGYFVASRLILIEESWRNFVAHPFWGIGFGIPTQLAGSRGVASGLGLPLSLANQKGFLGTMLLEEIGIVGSLAFLPVIVAQMLTIRTCRTISVVVLYLTALAVNLGETAFFSIGGIGILVQVALATALVAVEQQSPASNVRETSPQSTAPTPVDGHRAQRRTGGR
jgi:hypothetical protein